MEYQLKARLHNRFDIEVVDARTEEVRQTAQAENLILDGAWTHIINFNYDDTWNGYYPVYDWFGKIRFGTGTGTLSAARTALFTPLGTKTCETTEWSFNQAENYASLRRRITLLESEYIGSILSEVGVATGASSDVLCTHALLKDMNGNDVTIEKTGTDIIYIYGTTYLQLPAFTGLDMPIDFFRCWPGSNPLMAGLLGQRVISFSTGGTFNETAYSMHPDLIAAYTGEVGSVHMDTYQPSGYIYIVRTPNTAPGYTQSIDLPNRTMTIHHRIPAANGNDTAGIKMLLLGTGNSYRHRNCLIARFPSAYHTQARLEEQIGTGDGINSSFATSFPFIQGDAVVKVDGTPVNATIFAGVPKVKNILSYMKIWGASGSGYRDASLLFSGAGDQVVENPFYASFGIDTMKGSTVTIYKSDNKTDWIQVFTTTGSSQTYTVAAGDKQSRYWKFTKSGTGDWSISEINCNALDNLKNVVTETPPPNGSIVTADYATDVAAKDLNHVLDITFSIVLNDATP